MKSEDLNCLTHGKCQEIDKADKYGSYQTQFVDMHSDFKTLVEPPPRAHQHIQASNQITRTFHKTSTLCILWHRSKDPQIRESQNRQNDKRKHYQTRTERMGAAHSVRKTRFQSGSILHWKPAYTNIFNNSSHRYPISKHFIRTQTS